MVKKPGKGTGGDEACYRDLIELAPDLVCVLTDGIITLINKAGARSLGAKDADILIGEPFKSFIHPDCHDAVSDDLADVAKKGAWVPLKLVRIGGTVIDVELAASCLDQAGTPGIMVVTRDTTESKRAAEMLLHREERLRGIMDTVIDGIISIDDHGTIDSFNTAAQQVFGYTADDVIGKNVKVLMPDPYHSEHDGYLSRYLRTGEARIIGSGREVLGKRKDGSLFPVDLAVSELRRGGRSYFIGVVRDITQRKEAEAELRRSEERYALALDGTNEAIWDWDIEKKKYYVSPRIQEVFGMDINSWTDPKALWKLLHRDDVEQYRATLVAHLKGKTDIFEVECRLADGVADGVDEVQWFRQRGVALRDADGWAYRMAGSIANVTERKRDEELLRKAKEDADIASRTKTEFLANMSHELRTPLNAIIGFSDIMREQMFGPLGNAQYQEYVINISESGKHLLEIINDILDVARIEAGTLDLHTQWVEIAPVIEASTNLIRERAIQAGVMLRRSVQKDLPRLRSEPRRIKQILINLLSNAVKFTPKGGQITTRAKLLKSGDLMISVADTGIGMSADEIVTALTPFGQVDGKLARKYEGTGLGLPLTKAFVELHGGRLDIRSVPGKGTNVTVRFGANRLRP